MTTLALVAITVYAGQYVGQPLYCDAWDTELFYDNVTPAWAAMPDSFWQSGGQCWDKVGVKINGQVYVYYALDRIAPGDWYVRQPDGVLLPIAADIPEMHAPFPGLSTVGRAWNVTMIQDEWGRHR